MPSTTPKRSLWQRVRATASTTYRNRLRANEAAAAARLAAHIARVKAQVDEKMKDIKAVSVALQEARAKIATMMIPSHTHPKKGSKTRRNRRNRK